MCVRMCVCMCVCLLQNLLLVISKCDEDDEDDDVTCFYSCTSCFVDLVFMFYLCMLIFCDGDEDYDE